MTNPLSQYFRQPAIYIRLPSNGDFYPEGSLVMPENGELPVMPMTAIDEITYRTPDALFNGTAVVSVIQSCLPNIKNAWAVPSIDLDTILASIRIASYGHSMDVNCVCTKCDNEDTYAVDLRTCIDQIEKPDYATPIRHGDLEIYFRPLTYKMLNYNNQVQFEEQKMLQALNSMSDQTQEQQSEHISNILRKITDMTVNAIAQSVAVIKTPASLVSDTKQIADFLVNCDRRLFNQIRDRVIDLKSDSEIKPLSVTCTNCQNEYKQGFTLDLASFFDSAS